MIQKIPGFSANQQIDISKVNIGKFERMREVDTNLVQKNLILYYYANYRKSKKDKKANGWLNCSAGNSVEDLKKKFDFVILFYAKRISAKEATKIFNHN